MEELLRVVSRKTMDMNMNVDKRGDWDWGAGVALYGLLKAWESSGDEGIFGFVKGFIDKNMKKVKIPLSVNTTAPLLSALMLWEKTREVRYKDICVEFAQWLINEAPRTVDGGLAHGGVGCEWHDELWVDTIFMAGMFLKSSGVAFKQQQLVQEGLEQVKVHIKYIGSGNGLFYHGYNHVNKNNKSAILWGRGNSWVTVSIPYILEGLQEHDEKILKAFQSQVDTLCRLQHESGLWHTVLDEPQSYLETSATAGITCGLLAGMRLGLISQKFMPYALRGYQGVISKIATDGTVMGASRGTGIRDTKESYMSVPTNEIMPWGQGLTLMMLVEMKHFSEEKV